MRVRKGVVGGGGEGTVFSMCEGRASARASTRGRIVRWIENSESPRAISAQTRYERRGKREGQFKIRGRELSWECGDTKLGSVR